MATQTAIAVAVISVRFPFRRTLRQAMENRKDIVASIYVMLVRKTYQQRPVW